ncbi:GNAT family N-acetyltransferase [Thalassobaculum sp. OXR-137]|uniref:GNAT family N-acetyltransferase n=1 Tax=Thalassobaculum sp. OXR-137 TaxID=3100173 RepID=UPI002AC94024|nr:GNAT family N-acetyltransferase [Thalassobaculum sp. OXR-137]WPZ36611.1 GNAT family N-acetyltransferase [Thalassobaculum sp. OXR-137]
MVPVRPLSGAVVTDRLILEPVSEAWRADLVAFLGEPAVMSVRKLGVLDPQAASAVVDDMIDHWREYGFGMYAVIERATGTFLGECGLRYLEDGTVPEISYGLLPAARGKGYAREAATATLRHGFGPLGQKRLVAFARGDNVISRTLLESLGFTLLWERPKEGYSVVHYEALPPSIP